MLSTSHTSFTARFMRVESDCTRVRTGWLTSKAPANAAVPRQKAVTPESYIEVPRRKACTISRFRISDPVYSFSIVPSTATSI